MPKQEKYKDEFIFRIGGEGVLEIIDRGNGDLRFKALALLVFFVVVMVFVLPREGWYLNALQVTSLVFFYIW